MSDTESRKAFEAWAKSEFVNGPLEYSGMYRGWLARDAEITALKARVEELEAKIPCPRPINGVDIPTDAKWCIDNGHCGCGLSGEQHE